MKKIFNFFKEIYDSASSTSSKRFFGSIGFIVYLVYIGVFDHALISQLGILSTALLGLGIADNYINRK